MLMMRCFTDSEVAELCKESERARSPMMAIGTFIWVLTWMPHAILGSQLEAGTSKVSTGETAYVIRRSISYVMRMRIWSLI
jgi:hypothetical protein